MANRGAQCGLASFSIFKYSVILVPSSLLESHTATGWNVHDYIVTSVTRAYSRDFTIEVEMQKFKV